MAMKNGDRRHEEYSCHWGFVLLAAKVWHWIIMTGLLKSFSIFIPHLVELMGTTYAVIGLVCGMTDSMGCLVAPLSAFIIKRSPARILAVVGAFLCSGGVIGASFCHDIVPLGICMTCLGIGNVFLVVTITTGLHEHFPVKFEVINSIAIIGSPMGAFLTPVITETLLEFYGLHGTILILGGVSLNLVVCALTVRPPGRRRRRKRVGGDYVAVDKFSSSANGDEIVGFEGMKEFELTKTDHDESERKEKSSVTPQTNDRSTSLKTYILDITNLSVLQRNPFYVFFLIANFLMMVIWMGWTLFLVPHAESLGISQSQAAYLAMIAGIGAQWARVEQKCAKIGFGD